MTGEGYSEEARASVALELQEELVAMEAVVLGRNFGDGGLVFERKEGAFVGFFLGCWS